jgi:hypothetical protein
MKDTPRTVMFNTFAIEGMTLRDYFAAKVLPCLIGESGDVDVTVEAAYVWADAMMEVKNASI